MAGELTPSDPWEGVLDFAECALFVADHTLHLLWCNDAFTKVMGWSREQLATLEVHSLVHPDDRPDTQRITSVALDRLQARSFVCRMLDADGGWRWIRWDGRPLADQRIVGRARRIDLPTLAPAGSPKVTPPETQSAQVEGIVHDFNNLLFALTAGIELANEQVHAADVLVDTLSMLDRAVTQARKVNRRLLDLLPRD